VGAEDYSTLLEYSGREALGIGVEQLSNANALEVDRAAKARSRTSPRTFRRGCNTLSHSTRQQWSATRSAKC